jgi:hypothetical protein
LAANQLVFEDRNAKDDLTIVETLATEEIALQLILPTRIGMYVTLKRFWRRPAKPARVSKPP